MRRLFIILTILLMSAQCYATDYCEDAYNVGCFLMEDEGDETDRGGNTSNTLTQTSGTIPLSETKVFGTYSRDFEAGDTEYLAHADGLATDINGADATMSICMWVNPESLDGTRYFAGKYLTSNGSRQYALAILSGAAGKPAFLISHDGTNVTTVTYTDAMLTGNWYHICGVYNDANIYVYVNGDSVSTNLTTGIYNGDQEFKIGSGGAPSYWDGLIDEVGIWSRALSSEEITDIMNNGLNGAAPLATRIYNATIYNATIGQE
jgi:hypothetical protein